MWTGFSQQKGKRRKSTEKNVMNVKNYEIDGET